MLYISPPFGNYFSYKDAIRVKGTFTAHPREGLIYHTLRSLRPIRGGWRNQIGFRNKGIGNITIQPDYVYSICGLNYAEWEILLYTIPQGTKVELNLSCPNVSDASINTNLLEEFLNKFPALSVKIRYDISEAFANLLYDTGVKTIHTSNTIPTDRGGLSGKPLKKLNMSCVESLAKMSFDSLIAGGGIYSKQDVVDYRNAGATDFSISTVYISCPWNIPKIYSIGVE